jgi:hypothetical protein
MATHPRAHAIDRTCVEFNLNFHVHGLCMAKNATNAVLMAKKRKTPIGKWCSRKEETPCSDDILKLFPSTNSARTTSGPNRLYQNSIVDRQEKLIFDGWKTNFAVKRTLAILCHRRSFQINQYLEASCFIDFEARKHTDQASQQVVRV